MSLISSITKLAEISAIGILRDQTLVEPVVALDVRNPDPEQIVYVAGHPMRALDLRHRSDGLFEPDQPILFMGAGADDHEDGQAQIHRFRVDQGHAPANDLPLFHLLDAPPAGVARQVRFRGQFIHADRRIALQTSQDSAVGFIEFCAHGGMISQENQKISNYLGQLLPAKPISSQQDGGPHEAR